ncbi:MAG: exodeoxyribonuclease VII small subunit [Bacteroidales bacterium]|nr:exodeoxyribonuclease VII small subunit [Bacteroidales bacterium]HPD96196.1 exodeoxyribonuclease VII small subunit [Tenuifilaceae bacterium]HRX31789.1 exodeoxyribonuclease VII small subunit [Tenuifilaceae bacterium]
MTKKALKYNEAIAEVEKIISEIEDNETDLDELASKLKRAAELLNFCKAKLRSTEEEIQKIIEDFQTDQ